MNKAKQKKSKYARKLDKRVAAPRVVSDVHFTDKGDICGPAHPKTHRRRVRRIPRKPLAFEIAN